MPPTMLTLTLLTNRRSNTRSSRRQWRNGLVRQPQVGSYESTDVVNSAKWPAMVEPLLERLQHITHREFPTPRPYTNITPHPRPVSPIQDREEASEQTGEQPQPDGPSAAGPVSQSPATPVRSLPPVPLFPNSSATTTSHIPDSLPPSQTSPPLSSLETLPTPLLQLLESITSTIRYTFPNNPPHTIQRLAELTLYPTKHYKTLPAWLRAVDRIVNVSSSAGIFPLSEAPPLLVNGVNGDSTAGGILYKSDSQSSSNSYDKDSLGSDESLGGALLTPIPWLRNTNPDHDEESKSEREAEDDGLGDPIELGSEVRESRNSNDAMTASGQADPLVPEREDGAVTQGELIRMEQEAGVVPVAVSRPTHTIEGEESNEETDDAVPHARGPDLVGAIDMGKVDGKDVQVRIGSPPGLAAEEGKTVDPNDAQDVLAGGEKDGSSRVSPDTAEGFEIVRKEDEMQVDEKADPNESQGRDKDDDIVLVDADGKTEEEAAGATP